MYPDLLLMILQIDKSCWGECGQTEGLSIEGKLECLGNLGNAVGWCS